MTIHNEKSWDINAICINMLWDATKRRETAVWRRERDSNPRDGFPPTRFPSVRLQPLGHPSGALPLSPPDGLRKAAAILARIAEPVCTLYLECWSKA